MRRNPKLAALLAIFMAGALMAQISVAPRKGFLVLTGGDFGKGVIERFTALAGGWNANWLCL